MNISVNHNRLNKEFVATVDGKRCGHISYETPTEQNYILRDVFVQEGLRNRGVATILMENTLLYLQKQHVQIASQCSFVNHFLNRHPEYNCVIWREAV